MRSCLKRPSSAFASDISARATRAYLSWCGLFFSERLRWKEMSRSGKTPATIWGEEGILSPASGSSSQWSLTVIGSTQAHLSPTICDYFVRAFGVRPRTTPFLVFISAVCGVAFATRFRIVRLRRRSSFSHGRPSGNVRGSNANAENHDYSHILHYFLTLDKLVYI